MERILKEIPKQKEIVLIDFTYSDLSSSKIRPAIVISNDNYNSKTEDVLIVPLTTKLKKIKYNVEIEQKDLEKGILHYKSQIRTDKPYSIKKNLIKMKIGIIHNEILREIIQSIIALLKSNQIH